VIGERLKHGTLGGAMPFSLPPCKVLRKKIMTGTVQKKNYSEKLRDPRWQQVRLKILERDGFTCVWCGDKEKTLHVHHFVYKKNPWEVGTDDLMTLCEDCHQWLEDLISNTRSLIRHDVEANLLMDLLELLDAGHGLAVGQILSGCRKMLVGMRRVVNEQPVNDV
jgi:HNH endonuclease